MNQIIAAVNYVLSFKSYVMLPILMLILCIIVRMKLAKAVKACMTLGIGFIGIFIVFDYFVGKIGPVISSIVQRTGSQMNVLDVGWPPLAAITWSFKLAPLLIIIILLVNIVMLVFKWTETVNIDIWNFWHFIFTAQLVFTVSGSLLLSICSAIFASILCIKLADWSADRLQEFSGLEGVVTTTLSGLAYYPTTLFINKIIDKIPGLSTLEADPKTIQKKLGFFGESMFIGFIMGIGLGVVAGFSLKDVLELGFSIAAVVFILPKMCGILGEGIMPISDSMKAYMLKRFPNMKNSYIGLDLAIIVGQPAVVVSGILLMPVALILAFILPGIKFIPIGDLPNMIGAVAVIVVATRGNIIRACIAAIPVIIAKLYIASAMAPIYTSLAKSVDFKVNGYDGIITSFLDGGNAMRFWIMKLFTGNIWAIIIIPVVVYLLYITRLDSLKKKSV